jgi:hypothetical protein
MKILKILFFVIAGILAIILLSLVGNLISSPFLDLQKLIAEVFYLLITNGLFGLCIVLLLINIPDWITSEYHLLKFNANDYWRTHFPAWLKKRIKINLVVVAIYAIYWLIFSPDGSSFVRY